MMQDKLAAAGAASGPIVMAVDWLTTLTDVLQAVLLVVSIFATFASGLYYGTKWLRERNGKSN